MAGALFAALLATQPALSQRRPDPNPDATVEIEEVRVGLFVFGGTVGGGRLRYRGEEFAFTVRGIELGSVGISSASARGEVFGLSGVRQFAGLYVEQERRPSAQGGPAQVMLRNEAGVTIRLRSEREGGVLRIAPGGLHIAFRE